jgi:hypothetical protein
VGIAAHRHDVFSFIARCSSRVNRAMPYSMGLYPFRARGLWCALPLQGYPAFDNLSTCHRELVERQPINLSTYQFINLSTYQPINQSTNHLLMEFPKIAFFKV